MPAPGAERTREDAVHVDHVPRARRLVERVDILRHDHHLAGPVRLQPRERGVRGVETRRRSLRAAGVTLVTQNVDDLLGRAGARGVIHMHGELARAACHACRATWEAPAAMGAADPCPACGTLATRPDVVWFGEMPYHMGRIEAALDAADLFVAIGTSGTVYPAAGFAGEARMAGARTLELNLEATGGPFDEVRAGPASRIVPAWVDEIMGPGMPGPAGEP
jgi:NAD-dependent deacetylase